MVLRKFTDCIDFSNDGLLVASVIGARFLKIINVETGEVIREITNGKRIHAVSFCPSNNDIIAYDTIDNTIVLFNISSGSVEMRLSGHSNQITSVGFSMDGRIIVSSGAVDDDRIILWDASTGRIIRTFSTDKM